MFAAPKQDHKMGGGIFALLFLTAILSACSDEPEPVVAPEPSLETVVQIDAEKTALDQLTRAVALALQDPGLRHRILNDLRQTPFREHKLEFSSYVHGNNGGILLTKMANATGENRDALLALLESVRPLEFYMPLDAHRASWTGGDNLLVTSLLDDGGEEMPTTYKLNGELIFLGLHEVPNTPTLSLVPVETDFSDPLSTDGWVNTQNANGRAIGNYRRVNDRNLHHKHRDSPSGTTQKMNGARSTADYLNPPKLCDPLENPACDPRGGGGGGGGSYDPPTAGHWMSYSYINIDGDGDMGEAAAKGDPEIEIHVHGPTDSNLYGEDLACSGNNVYHPERSFNQDDTWSGNILIFSQAEIANYNSKFGEHMGYNVMVWEDDDTSCVIKTDKDMVKGALVFTKDMLGVVAVAVSGDWIATATDFIAALYESASWLRSNDEFIGDAVKESDIPAYSRDGNSSTNYTIYRGGNITGGVHLWVREPCTQSWC